MRQTVSLKQETLTVSSGSTFSFWGGYIGISTNKLPLGRFTNDLIKAIDKCGKLSNQKFSLLEERTLES